MTVLGIESAGARCGAAAVRDGRILAAFEVDGAQLHSERLVGLIGQCLGAAGAEVVQLDGIGVSLGPGSFTGLRISMSVAKGLAYAAEKPLAGISTLAALATQALLSGVVKGGQVVMPLIDAHREGVCAALFRIEENRAVELASVSPVSPEDCALLVRGPVVVVGDGADKFRAVVMTQGGELSRLCSFPGGPMGVAGASAVALMAEKEFAAGRGDDLESLEPLYVGDAFRRAPAVLEPEAKGG